MVSLASSVCVLASAVETKMGQEGCVHGVDSRKDGCHEDLTRFWFRNRNVIRNIWLCARPINAYGVHGVGHLREYRASMRLLQTESDFVYIVLRMHAALQFSFSGHDDGIQVLTNVLLFQVGHMRGCMSALAFHTNRGSPSTAEAEVLRPRFSVVYPSQQDGGKRITGRCRISNALAFVRI